MIAIIQTGGKQYQVAAGEKLRIEKIEGESGTEVTFDDVLLVGDETSVKVGQPQVAGAKVMATIFRQGKAKKVTGIKHHAKKRYKVKFGHRQLFTEVEIVKISA